MKHYRVGLPHEDKKEIEVYTLERRVKELEDVIKNSDEIIKTMKHHDRREEN